MKPLELIKFLNQENIFIFFKDGKLVTRGKKGKLTPEIQSLIKENKDDILDFFKNKQYPLSFSQERMWFIDKIEKTAGYNIPGAIRIKGKLNIEILKKVLNEIVNRHEILRTNFISINNSIKQFIHKKRYPTLEIQYFKNLESNKIEDEIQKSINIESQYLFDLEKDCLIRVILYKINDSEFVLFLNKHHIISDGWSFSVLFKEITILYKAFLSSRNSPLKELPIQYADYAVWQRENLKDEQLTKQSNYWKNKLKNTPILELPTDKSRPEKKTTNGASIPVLIDKKLTKDINNLCNENNATLFMVLLSAFKVLLYRYTNQVDICIGTPIANRKHTEIENMIGLFANTLALRTSINPNESFLCFLNSVKKTTLEAYDHQDIPFEKVVEVTDPVRNLSYSPLFQVMLVLQNNPTSKLEFSDLKIEPVEYKTCVSKFDLTLNLTESEKGIHGKIDFNTDLFNQESIECLINNFFVLLTNIISEPTTAIREFDILTQSEKQKLLNEWNNTNIELAKEKSIIKLFEAQACKTPNNIAIVFGEEKLSYSQLNKLSTQLAHEILKKGERKDFAAIYTRPSLELVIGILGILKAGYGFLPLDPEHNASRHEEILQKSNCKLIISANNDSDILNNEIQKITVQKILQSEKTDILPEVPYNSLAYIIFTSGSTGKPKGVKISQENIINYYTWGKDFIGITPNDKTLLTASFAFDAIYTQFFITLLVGGELHIIPRNTILSPGKLIDYIDNNKISFLKMTPTLFGFVTNDQHFTKTSFKSVRSQMIGGECINIDDVGKVLSTHPHIQFINHYGPTETTVGSVAQFIDPEKFEDYRNHPTIGNPICNTQCYILNKEKKLMPIGCKGELYIGGKGVGMGYLNLKELTNSVFLKNPFRQGECMYKTGDLARWKPNGKIEIIGRIDNQVKLRGFRIELGEIESVLNKQKEVEKSIVVINEDTNNTKQLIAYIVPLKKGSKLNTNLLRNALTKHLPYYMIPSAFNVIENIPLTPNGKLDKKKLSNIRVQSTEKENFIAPQTETEIIIADVWKEVLKHNKISIEDNFFELGGNSLLIIGLISKINSRLKRNLSIQSIFENQTIRLLSAYLDSNKNSEWSPLITIRTQGTLRPFYLIAGQGGDIAGMQQLTSKLSADFPVYGLQYSGLDLNTEPDNSIEEIARKNIIAIKQIQPNGPYTICGYSLGGLVAYEMCRQLILNGEKISNLVLLDTRSPELSKLNSENEENLKINFVRSIENRYNINSNLSNENIIESSYRECYNIYRKALKSNYSEETPIDYDVFSRMAYTAKQHQNINYNPPKDKPFCIPAILFRAQNDNIKQIDLGWKYFIANKLSIISIPGNHNTIIQEPNVSILAAKISQHIQNEVSLVLE